MLSKDIKTRIEGNGNILIEGISNSTITINPENGDEIREFLLKFQEDLSQLPTEILNILKTDEEDIKLDVKGVKMFLGLSYLVSNFNMAQRDVAYSLTITNFERTTRFFKRPYFKTSKAIKISDDIGPQDTFYLIPSDFSSVKYPKRLEFGEQLTDSFQFMRAQLQLFEQIGDDEQYIQAFILTTFGELFSSNKYYIKELTEKYTQFMQE
jgi:hypothetical protein